MAEARALDARPGHRLIESDGEIVELWPGSRSGNLGGTRRIPLGRAASHRG